MQWFGGHFANRIQSFGLQLANHMQWFGGHFANRIQSFGLQMAAHIQSFGGQLADPRVSFQSFRTLHVRDSDNPGNRRLISLGARWAPWLNALVLGGGGLF
jgi:hypothetical protein